MKRLIFLYIALVFVSSLVAGDFRTPVRAQHGMVVSIDHYASQVGVDIMKKGGNAVDAAVAVGFALAVVHPQAGNIGGGGFMVIRFSDNTSTTIDYREKAPGKSRRDMYLDRNGDFIDSLSTIGYLASGVPGSVAGLYLAQQKFGVLKWRDVIEPAFQLAQEGIIVSAGLSRSIQHSTRLFKRFPASVRKFLPGGDAPKEGDLWMQKDLAKTLKLIADKGPEAFYKGEIADMIVKAMKANGGLITHEDLQSYQAVERQPVTGSYHGYDIISMGPPSSGGLCLIEALNILKGFELSDYPAYSARSIQLIAETMKRVYADRAEYMGDSDYFPVPISKLISPDYGEKRGEAIQIGQVIPSSEIGHGNIPIPESHQTTHYSVVDAEGNAVSVTTTLNSGFGSKVVVAGAGFLLNNEMDDFSAKPGTPNIYGLIGGEANAIEPGKRMLSSMTPTIITKDNQLWAVIGTPGGSTIISQVLVAILNMIDYNMNVAEAVSAPKFHHQWMPDVLECEQYGISSDTIEILQQMGYKIRLVKSGYGDLNGIQIEADTGVRLGCADPRNDGAAIGY